MADHQDLVDNCASILKCLTPPKHWMTAAGLSKKLGGKYKPDQITQALRAHAQSADRVIRYSFYPSRKTLSDLWGHVDVVEEHRTLPDLERQDAPHVAVNGDEVAQADETAPSDIPENAPWVFLSHNHRDAELVFEIKEKLACKKVGVWTFETGIEEHHNIGDAVKWAMDECSHMVVYISYRSVGSLWVSKEFNTGMRRRGLSTNVFIDGRDHLLVEFLTSPHIRYVNEYPELADLLDTCAEMSGRTHCDAFKARCRDFLCGLMHHRAAGIPFYIYPSANHGIDDFAKTILAEKLVSS